MYNFTLAVCGRGDIGSICGNGVRPARRAEHAGSLLPDRGGDHFHVRLQRVQHVPARDARAT